MKRLGIITGATSGIGYEFAKILANEDIDLLLISRSTERLENTREELKKLTQNDVDILELDLSSGDYDKLEKKLEGRNLKYLINNAGFGDFGEFVYCDIQKQNNMIDLNIKGLTNVSKIFLDHVKDNDENTYLLNLGSIAGFMPGPLMSTYYATKAYVVSFTKAIAFENRNKYLSISCLCPGPTATNFIKSSSLEGSFIFNKKMSMTPEKVAKVGYKKMIQGKRIIIPGLFNRIGVKLALWLPDRLVEYVTYKVMLKK